MKLNVFDELRRAKSNGILDKVYNNEPSLTYQQFALYNMLRVEYSTANEETCFDPQAAYEAEKVGGVIDGDWLTMKASKYHPISIDIPWDKVFDK